MSQLFRIILLVVLPLAWGLGIESLFALVRAALARRKESRQQP
jgi:hypothetical protein